MTLNFNTICRTCMSHSQTLMYNIFGFEKSSEDDDIVVMLSSITSIKALKNDGLPENICIGCLGEINRAFSFKTRSERSENTLKQYIKQITNKSTQDSDFTRNENSSTSDDEHFEVIEIDEDVDVDQDVVQDVVQDNLPEPKNDTEKHLIEHLDDKSSNDEVVLNEQKVFVLDDEPTNQISVVYESHICYDSFDTISLSEQHIETCHGFMKKPQCEDVSVNHFKCSICNLDFDDTNSLDKHFRDEHHEDINDDEDEQNVGYGFEDDHLTNVVEVSEMDEDECRNGEEVEVTSDVINSEEEPIASVIVLNTSESIGQELKFNCNKCGGKFAEERSLNIHTKLNKCTIKNFECPICKKVFIRKKNLEIHMQSHGESNNYSCKFCLLNFTQADKLALHVQNEHEPNRKYLCPYCWKGFSVSSSLKDHIRIHNGERPFLCSICGKGFSQSTNLNQHVMRHNKTKPYSCSVCSYSFVSKGELNAHSRKHSGLHPFVCDVCNASFTTSSSLVKHKRIHTGERPYVCEYCPMRFAALGTLKNHTRTHNGSRPFACGTCGRTFSQRSDCLSHQDTHSANKLFFCKNCHKSFHKRSGLRNHMKIHRKECVEDSASSSINISNDSDKNNMRLTYVTEIYSD